MSFSSWTPSFLECGFNLHIRTKLFLLGIILIILILGWGGGRRRVQLGWSRRDLRFGMISKKKKIPLIHNKKKCSGAKTSTFLFLLHQKYKIKVTRFHI